MIHLAAAVGVKLIVESPVRTIETNVRGTEVVLALANKKKKARADCFHVGSVWPERRRALSRRRQSGDGRDDQGPLELRLLESD